MKTIRNFFKLAFATGLLLVSGPLFAQGTITAGFALPGSTTLLTELDLSNIDANDPNDPGRTFELDIIHQSDQAEASGFLFSIFLGEDMTAGDIIDPVSAGVTGPSAGPSSTFPTAFTGAIDGVTYVNSVELSWADQGNIPAHAAAGADTPYRVATMEFTYGASGGDRTMVIGDQGAATGFAYEHTTLTIKGPLVPKKAVICLGTAAITDFAECEAAARTGYSVNENSSGQQDFVLSGVLATAATAATTFELTATDGSGTDDEAGGITGPISTNDYTAADLPATDDTLSFAIGDTATSMDHSITPDSAGFGGVLNLSFTVDPANAGAGDDFIADELLFTKFTLTTSGLMLSTETISTGGAGDSQVVQVSLLSDPGDGESVTVTPTSSDNSHATVAGSVTFTGGTCTEPTDAADVGNWCNPQDVTIRAQGTAPGVYMIFFDVTEGAADYVNDDLATGVGTQDAILTGTNGISGSGTLTEATVTKLPASWDPTANAGEERLSPAKMFSITATIDGSIGVAAGEMCTVNLTFADGTPVPEPDVDYANLMKTGLTITIEGPSRSGSGTFGIDTIDTDDMDVEVFDITATSNCGTANTAFTGGTLSIIDKTAGDAAAMLNVTVAPVVLQQTIAHAQTSVAARVQAPTVNNLQFSLNGHDSTEGAMLEHMRSMSLAQDAGEDPADIEYDWKNVLAKSNILMPLNGGGGSFWLNGDYRSLDVDTQGVTANGDTLTLSLGADVRISPSMLAGLMFSTYESETDYTDTNITDSTGKYTLEGTSIRPYFGWTAGALSVWGNIGIGEGEMEVQNSLGGVTTTETADTEEFSYAIGAKQQLVEGLAVKADVTLATIDISESGTIEAQSIDSQRTRLMLEGRNTYNRANGSIQPNVEIGIRHDLVEDDLMSTENSSTGAEAAAGVDFANRATGVTLSTKVRFYSGSDYDEWGISGTISKKAAARNLGLAFNMTPTHGDVASGVQSLFDTSFENTMSNDTEATADADYSTHFNTGMSYGFHAPGARGVMLPYTEAKFGDSIDGQHKLGLNWKPSARFDFDVHGGQKSANSIYGLALNWNRPIVDFKLSGSSAEEDNNVVNNTVKLTGTIDF